MAAHMDLPNQSIDSSSTTPLAQLLLLFILPLLMVQLLLHVSSRRKPPKKKPLLPPSPPALPVIGHLLLIGNHPHVSLRDLAAKHSRSGLMLLRLGTVPNLIVSSPGAARAVMRTYDHVFASRPASAIIDGLVYGSSSVGFTPYGEHWRQVRKLVTTHLLTVRKVHSYHAARQEEVRLVIAKLREAATVSAEVDISEMMNAFANDIICRAVCGKFFRAEGRNKLFRELNHVTTALIAGFNMEDYFPGLANSVGLLFTRFMSNKVNQTHKKWDKLLEEIIGDHERRKGFEHGHGRGGGVVEQEESDFIDVMLSIQEEYGITRDHIKAILMDMFEAGTATSSLVLEFAMVELLRNPHLMSKLQAEVRKKMPNKGQQMVKEENLADMVYLRAVVKETLRLHPPVPLLIPHLSMADCDINGYTIPSGTRVIINSWDICRDPKSWEKAEEFLPERFMDGGSAEDIDFKGNDFQFTPFGAGRRMCPGINFGLATINIMLANLMYCFDWTLPGAMKKEDIDMTEVFGLTVHRKEKLILVPKPHVTFAQPMNPEAGSITT